MKRKVSISTTIALVLLAAALTVSITMMLAMRHFNNQLQLVSQRQVQYEHIDAVDKQVREYYTPNEAWLKQSIAKGYIEGLNDPYAGYFTAEQYKTESLRLTGKSSTIGITLCRNSEGLPAVGYADKNGSGYKQGLRAGDVLVTINGEAVEGKTLDKLQKLVDTTGKDPIALTVLRGEESKSFNPTPGTYTITSVDSEMQGTIGYVKITAFYGNTANQLKKALTALQQEGAASVVFDLRDNKGGTPEAAQECLGYILPMGPYAKTVDVKGNEVTLSNANNSQLSLSSVTLVNAGTTGEAEFFAGVLQDFGLTTVVGETTAGKAKYQSNFQLDTDKSVLWLTVGEYKLLKADKNWQDEGIQPDVVVELPKEQAAMSMLLPKDVDAQLQAALKELAGDAPVQTEPTDSTTETESTKKTEATKETEKTTKKTEKTTKKTTKTTKK